MAHFAKVKNNLVEQVIVIDDKHETNAQDFINKKLGLEGTWIQTSYNTIGGKHLNDKTPLRKNFAGIGYTYDEERDAFIPPKPYDSWELNEESCLWEAPVARPQDGNIYQWNESTLNWELVETEEE